MQLSPRNSELLDLLQGEYQRKYEPNFAVANAASTILALPGLRGYWPMSVVSSTPTAIDVSGLGKALAYNGNPTFGYDRLAPCVIMDGIGDYLSRADEADLDILGSEAYITSPGLTVGGWAYATALTATSSAVISKNTGAGNQRSWIWFFNGATNVPIFRISTNGIASISVTHTTAATTGGWYFIAGRFIPSTELAVWLNDEKVTNVVGIAATLFNSTAALQVGASDAGLLLLNGKLSNMFLCASALSDTQITNVYEQTRALYGV